MTFHCGTVWARVWALGQLWTIKVVGLGRIYATLHASIGNIKRENV